MDPGHGPAPRVSIVVPVYNPGRHIEPGIASVLGQTLPAAQLEAIFVDDGSTDGTPARLDRLAAEHPDIVHVIHIPPSGSPGRPRNIGIEAARGEYIWFLDADDELARDGLERAVAMADRNRSDIVVAKFASASIPRSQRLFEANIEHCTLAQAPGLVDTSLGPAKLFRRDFLLTHGIVFPEGWRLMEDQRFCLEAYLRAGVISVLADHPCYYYRRRDDGGHLTAEAIDPDRHFENLRRILDFVEAETEPGPLRDRIVRRFLTIEVLARVGEPTYQVLPDGDRARLFAAARSFVLDRIRPDLPGLDAIATVRCALLREGHAEELTRLAHLMGDVVASTELGGLTWQAGSLQLDSMVGLVFESAARPVTVSLRDGRASLDAALADERLGRSVDVTAQLARLRIDMVLRERPTVLEWYARARAESIRHRVRSGARPSNPAPAAEEIPVRTRARAGIDPLRVAAGTAAIGPGTWDVLVRLAGLGITRFAPLDTTHLAGTQATCRPALLGDPARVFVPVIEAGGLRVEVDPPPAVLADALAGRPVLVVRDGNRLILRLAMAAGPSAGSIPAEIIVRTPGEDRPMPAVLRASRGEVELVAGIAGLADAPAGPHTFTLRLGGPDAHAEVTLGSARIEGPARLRVEGLPRLGRADRAVASVRWPLLRGRTAARSLRGRTRRFLIPIARRLRGRVRR